MNDKNYKEKWVQKSNIQLLFLSILCILVFSSCGDQKTILEKIRESGELRFVTVESPLTYFKGSDGKAEGLEFDLASMFADSLGLDLNLIVVKNKHDVTSLINKNKAHLGSSASALSGYPDNTLEYGPAYITARRQLVYHQKSRKPGSISDLKEDEIVIGEDESYQTLLTKLNFFYPDLAWRVLEDKSMTEILKMVNDNKIPIAIADSNWIDMYRYLFPEVRVAFDITGELPVAWVYQQKVDRSLDEAVRKFISKINKNGSLDKLINHYYRYAKSFDYIDTRVFIENVHKTLPKYKELFKKSASETDLDWFLLAAMSYQESHWNPKAKSSTGVRGLMMLTTDTANSLGVEDRLDPEQSILGGARYLIQMKSRLPERIQGEDRLWFALAAYNVGYGHLEDARRLTQSQGGDADKWRDVRKRLPLLADEDWHQNTKYGYARGAEPVIYVKNIRRYYDILKWKDAEIKRVIEQHSQENSKGKSKESPIINSPVL
jgi:membrane-bound lytic murein transglycosylase F